MGRMEGNQLNSPLFAKEGVRGSLMINHLNQKHLKTKRKSLRKNQTIAEKHLWQFLRNKQLKGHKFFRQYSIGPYIVDFYCPKLKLAIESDGGQHNQKPNRDYDTKRSKYLSHSGIKTIRYWNNQALSNPKSVLEDIINICKTPPDLPFRKGVEL